MTSAVSSSMDRDGRFSVASLILLPLLLLRPAVGSSLCNLDTYRALQARWAAADEPCQQKLSFELWVVMKAEGTAADADAQHVLAECMNSQPVSSLSLKVVDGWEYVPSSDDCGHVIDSIPNSAAFACKNVADLEAICEDEGISRASRSSMYVAGDKHIRGHRSGPTETKPSRRLQSTVSEAGTAHEVAKLIAGLEARGCKNPRGDGQTLCVMSDSFDALGKATGLKASGDLPPDVDIIKDLPLDGVQPLKDEGSAMMELAYDIAPKADYKFNTAFETADIFASDIGVLAATEGCDVIVDDVLYFTSPAFRDGVISLAIDDAVGTHNVLYFSAAGNDGPGHVFTSSMECTILSTTDGTISQCPDGVLGTEFTNVFDDTRADYFRYLAKITVHPEPTTIILSWDEDEGDARDITISVWVHDGTALSFLYFENGITDRVATETANLPSSAADGDVYYVAVHQGVDLGVAPDVAMKLLGGGIIAGATGSSMYGRACATKAVSVGAIDWKQASGTGGVFSDPETSPVEEFSSRGPCSVRTNGVLEERSKPVTTAADSLRTSTAGFEEFSGTSAAAPVAAAIATLIRAACAPERVVGHDDMMAILTNYDYIIDYTTDAGGAKAYGPEAGYGIMSASKMLAWVDANCATACPGGNGGGNDDVLQPTPSPVRGGDDISPRPTTPSATLPPDSPDSEDDGDLVEAATKTVVTVTSTGFDERPGAEAGDIGCGTDGCMPELTRDGIVDMDESRWSCKENIVEPGKDNCEIKFVFEEAQDIKQLQVAFYRGGSRSRKLKLSINGDVVYNLEPVDTAGLIAYDIEVDKVTRLILESVGLDKDEWISLLEVRFLVAP